MAMNDEPRIAADYEAESSRPGSATFETRCASSAAWCRR